ncbi:hypothetical protein KI688_003663 [Linnemannia hyalina]|uniref:Uncharacterized protein n=1 Tax=Linnemannia hyalina TaxID=64524 RepID=A0A9P7XPW2_9FUNG|nr:hypothetical protein KI688_003663 [Linnemannia hyalina]
MGADWYNFVSMTAAAIPVPKEALQQPFNLPGFKLMTFMHEHYDNKLKEDYNEYHGAIICLADTELLFSSVYVIGPYEIPLYQASCKRMKHLDALMPAGIRESLVSAFEKYTGRKPDVVPGFWTIGATSEYDVQLHMTWSLGTDERIYDGDCDTFCFTVKQDADADKLKCFVAIKNKDGHRRDPDLSDKRPTSLGGELTIMVDRRRIDHYRLKEQLPDDESRGLVDTLITPAAVEMLHNRLAGRLRPIVTTIRSAKEICVESSTVWTQESPKHLEFFTSCPSIKEALWLFLYRHHILDAPSTVLENDVQLVEAAFGCIKPVFVETFKC